MRQQSYFATCKAVIALSATLGMALATSSATNAATLFATGFESPTYVTGNLAGQNGWTLDSGTSPFTVVANPFGTGQVVRAAGGSGTNWVFPVLNYTPTATERISVSADIARTVGATTATTSFGYAIDLYANNGAGARFARFGLATNASNQVAAFVTSRFNSTTGQFDSTAAVTNVLVSAGLNTNTLYNLRGEFNFVQKIWSLYSGTSLIIADIPFADATATGLSDADFQVSTATGATDVGYLDNYAVTTFAVPETSTFCLLGSGILPLVGMVHVVARRRKKS